MVTNNLNAKITTPSSLVMGLLVELRECGEKSSSEKVNNKALREERDRRQSTTTSHYDVPPTTSTSHHDVPPTTSTTHHSSSSTVFDIGFHKATH